MNRLGCIACLFCVAVGATAAEPVGFDPAILSESGLQGYRQLRGVREFAFGGIGAAETPSQGELALRRLLEDEFATDALIQLLIKAKPAGKMYALCGLHFRDRDLFNRELKKHAYLEEDRIPVGVIEGRTTVNSTTPVIIKDIKGGRYDKMLTRFIPELESTSIPKPKHPAKPETRTIPFN